MKKIIFKSLKKLYSHLDIKANDYEYDHEISSLFQNLRDYYDRNNRKTLKQKAQWEIDFFSFNFENGKLNPIFTQTDENGKIYEYPSLINFNDETYKYLISRLENTSNDKLKARYANILWFSPVKNIKYAKTAIDSYFQLYLADKNKLVDPNSNNPWEVVKNLEISYHLSKNIKYKIEDISNEFFNIINKYDFKSKSSHSIYGYIIKYVIDNKIKYNKEQYNVFKAFCLKDAQFLISEKKYHEALQMLEHGESLSLKTNNDTNLWIKKIAETYEMMLLTTTDETGLLNLHNCEYAVFNYKRINNKKKVKELSKRFIEIKKTVKLGHYSTKIDLTNYINQCKIFAKRILKQNSEKFIHDIQMGSFLLPKREDIEKNIKQGMKEAPLYYMIPKSSFDERGNTPQQFSMEDTHYWSIINEYSMKLNMQYIYLIRIIFYEAIRLKKLTPKILIEYFQKYTWFGKEYTRILFNMPVKVNWMALISPALNDFYYSMQIYILNPKYKPNIILSIDSLTLKIEGLLRDMCEFLGVNTIDFNRDKNGNITTKEKDIGKLLREEEFIKLFSEDDLLFFRFLLVEKSGLNLRHNVAHALFTFDDYSEVYMMLLILVLLKLGKYNFVDNVSTSDKI